MKMESAVPFIGMVIQQLAQVGLMVACEVTSAGLTTYTFLFYSSAISTLILIPLSFFFHRSALPPLWPTFIHGFFFLGIMGFLMQMLTLVGLRYSSPLLSTAILQLVPGFTFILAVLLRMETFEYKSLSTVAKTIGTLVSIIGALVATLYKGPDVLNSTLTSLPQFLNQPSNWVIGGLVAMIGALITSLLIISQAFVLKKYPAELIVMLYYSCGVTLLSLATCLITQRDLSSWIINTQPEMLALMYSAVFGSVFQLSINSWVVKRRGPLFVVMFHPLGIVFAMAASLFMGETIHVGSLVGSAIIVPGFYSVIWGKAKEWEKKKKSFGSNNNKMSLLQDKTNDHEVNL
ncbi:WAT1-related protein isoform X1 [Capsicum galapagoense]